MKIIGIVPPSRLRETENPYEDNAIFHELYTKRVEEAGGIPIGIIGVDGTVKEEALALCDAFLLCGGKRIFPYHFQVIAHALKTGKKLLGVCLGMQAIHSYFIAKEEQRNRPGKSILEVYEEMKKERYFFVEPVEGHWKCNPNRGEEHLVKQEIRILEDSVLKRFKEPVCTVIGLLSRQRIFELWLLRRMAELRALNTERKCWGFSSIRR